MFPREIGSRHQGKGELVMKLFARLFAAALIVAAGFALSSNAAAPTTKPSKTGAAHVTKPWSEVSSLTDEQKEKIHDIHSKFLEDRRALEKKEHDDVMALLTDQQKKEVADVENSSKAGKKPKPADAGAADDK